MRLSKPTYSIDTAGNAQPDSCTLMNAEGFDIAVVQRVPGMVSDEQWQNMVDALGKMGELVQLHNIVNHVNVTIEREDNGAYVPVFDGGDWTGAGTSKFWTGPNAHAQIIEWAEQNGYNLTNVTDTDIKLTRKEEETEEEETEEETEEEETTFADYVRMTSSERRDWFHAHAQRRQDQL